MSNAGPGGYHVYFWESNWGSRVGYYLNQTHRDPVLRKIFQTREFRIALSLGIDRQGMNEVLYHGNCQPRQVTVNRACSFFAPAYESAHAEYDPKRANRMLDELSAARARRALAATPRRQGPHDQRGRPGGRLPASDR